MRLQLADNIYETDRMETRKTYHRPYTGKPLVEFLKSMDDNGNFKRLKFDFGL